MPDQQPPRRDARDLDPETIEALRVQQRALAAASDGIIITDPRRPDNPIIYANPGFLRLSGYTADEVLGRNCRFLQGPDTDPEAVNRLRDAVAAGTDVRVTIRNYKKDGTPFWNELSVSPVRDDAGEVTHFIGVQIDVTERMETEEALRLQERAVAAARNGIIICDAQAPDQPIIYSNQAFERLTGYRADEIVGRNCRFLQGPDTEQEARKVIRRAVHEGSDCLVILKNYKKDGTSFWNELSISPVRDPRGRVTHFIGVQTDVTDYRRTEEENARLLAEIQNAAAQQRAFLRDILASVTEGRLRLCDTPADLPARLPAAGPTVGLSLASMRVLRKVAEDACEAQGMSDERWQDFVAGVGEAAMNAVVHAGGGTGEVRAAGGVVQVWITDHGTGISVENLPKATIERGFSTAGTMGHGFWLMLKTCDTVWLLTGPDGTTVVLQQHPEPPSPEWIERV